MSEPQTGDWLTRARHIFYGAATALVETIQDPDKRSENLSKLSLDPNVLAEDLAQKGERTEQEAIRYLDQLNQTPPPEPIPEPPIPEPPDPAVSPDEISDLMDLTRQIALLRLDLERIRTEPPMPN